MGRTDRRAKPGRQRERADARPSDAAAAAALRPAHAPASRHKRHLVKVPGRWKTVLLFGPVIFTGALLLFAVQPLIGRFLLPWFGGTPGVWTTCMLFFQSLLLGGYLYAHLLVRYVPTRWQVVIHALLVIAAVFTLPIIPDASWRPVDAQDPTWRIILLLAATIGLPYLVLSATSPLLQAWLVKSSPGVSPYRMFALSNLGSLIALLGYPLLLEPNFTRQQQAWAWSGGMVLFAVICVACGAFVWKRGTRQPPDERPGAAPNEPTAHGHDAMDSAASRPLPPWAQWGMWLALPLVASVLLLATTNTLSQDVAVVPFLWVLPLALYLVTFIIAFDSPRWYPRKAMPPLLALGAIWLMRVQWIGTSVLLAEQLAGLLISMFVACLFCHGELARLKPEARRLTGYYLTISLGGALGGVFVALAAPRLFDRFLELPLGLMAAAGLALLCYRRWPVPKTRIWTAAFGVASVGLLGFTMLGRVHELDTPLARSRNFYGSLTVFDNNHPDPAAHRRWITHGSITHGEQFQHPDLARMPTTYYHHESGVGLTLDYFPRRENRRVGVVGLGAGTLAAYGRPGDTFRFYEINPDVERFARQYFTFLKDSPATTEVVLGDARISLEREPPQAFDVLVLDAFSGDAIPTHLLTREAFAIYLRHLKPDGVLAVHISNRYLDLFHVVIQHAGHFRLLAPMLNDPNNISTWLVMTTNKEFILQPEVTKHIGRRTYDPTVKPWTDDYVSLLQILRWGTG
jgi:SAM-dependent methyltransferase